MNTISKSNHHTTDVVKH